MRGVFFSILVFAAALCASAAAYAATPAFPGAVGQGATASGGRGGDVYHVTTLEDYDPEQAEAKIRGSLRHALRSADGPRTIVFDVSGGIQLKSPLEIRKSDVTIAGQTSPGGVTVWGYPTEIVGVHNVIVRYLRFRTGDFNARGNRKSGGAGDLDAGSANSVNVGRAERIILDHLSVSWGMDETLSVTLSRDVTVQNCIIAESLDDSFHPKGRHGYGTLLRGELTPENQRAGVGGYTFYGNLWAHHRSRNPSIGGQQSLKRGQLEEQRRRTDVNLVNNVVYDWGDQAMYRSEYGDVRINLLGNAFICGPAKKANHFFREGTAGRTLLYQRGNWQDLDQNDRHDGQFVVQPEQIANAFEAFGDGDRLISEGEPFNFAGGITSMVLPATEAYARVIQFAGASLWRDAADERVVASVVHRTGRLINSQDEVRLAGGKLPGIDDLAVRRRPRDFDVDKDGIADDFERAHGLDPSNAGDGQASTLSKVGYTNLEFYLNQLAAPDAAER
jgi:hypothetical protein